MVCDRCISSVKEIFSSLEITPLSVELGEVKVKKFPSEKTMQALKKKLQETGFELLQSDTPILVSKIKAVLIELFSQDDIPEDFKLSSFLLDKFPYDYSHMSRVFSQHEKDTIEHYLIGLRVERAKELLSYKDQNVSEVAYRLGYASVAHFSRQFKSMVGISPSVYQNNPTKRKSLEDL